MCIFVVALCADTSPRCLVEISTPESTGEALQRELSCLLVSFCGSFKYLRLHDGDEPDMKPSHPCVSITLLFSKRTPRNAKKFHALLSEKNTPWSRYERPEAVRVPHEQLFLSKNHSSPLLGIISGNHIPGIRISVMFSSMKDEVINFYSVLTGVSPVLTGASSDNNGTSYITYPIARNLELQLIYNSSIRTDPSSNVAICIRIQDHEKISTSLHLRLTSSDEGHWETRDPVGNRVLLFTPFE